MRFFVQIAAIFAFVLVSSQFSHGHDISNEMNAHVHGHEITSADHKDNSSLKVGHDGVVHCGAHLLLLVTDSTLLFAKSDRSYGRPVRDERLKIHLTFDPPPPRV